MNKDHGIKDCPFKRGHGPFCLFCLYVGHWTSNCSRKVAKMPPKTPGRAPVNHVYFDWDESDEDEANLSDGENYVKFEYRFCSRGCSYAICSTPSRG